MVRIPSFHCRGHGFDPGWGTKILHAVRPKIKNKKEQNEAELMTTEAVSEKATQGLLRNPACEP